MHKRSERSFEERLLVERFEGLLEDVRQRAADAPSGSVLHAIESGVLEQGRELLRSVVQTQTQAAVDGLEKKRRRATVRNAAADDAKKDRPRAM